MKKQVLIALAFASVSSIAFAQQVSPFYGEVGYSQLRTKIDDVPGSFSPKHNAVIGTLGYTLNSNLSAEVMLGFSDTDTTRVSGVNIDSKIDNAFGLFIKPSYKVNNQVEVFGRLGVVRAKATVSALGMSDSDSDTSFAYGIGANYYFTQNVYGQLGYTSFFDKDGVKIRGANVSVGFRF